MNGLLPLARPNCIDEFTWADHFVSGQWDLQIFLLPVHSEFPEPGSVHNAAEVFRVSDMTDAVMDGFLRFSQMPGEIVVNLVSMKLCIDCSSSNKVEQASDRLYKVCGSACLSMYCKHIFPDVQALHAGILA